MINNATTPASFSLMFLPVQLNLHGTTLLIDLIQIQQLFSFFDGIKMGWLSYLDNSPRQLREIEYLTRNY